MAATAGKIAVTEGAGKNLDTVQVTTGVGWNPGYGNYPVARQADEHARKKIRAVKVARK